MHNVIHKRSTDTVAYLAAGTITAAIFIADTLTSLQIAVAVLYVVVIMLAAERFSWRSVQWVTALCLALTLLAFWLSHGNAWGSDAFARCLISLAAISISGFLALKSQSAKAELQRKLLLLAQSHDAVLSCDLQGRILSWNRGAVCLYGWSAEQALGQSLDELLGTPAALLEQVLSAGQVEAELTERHQSGRAVIVASRWSLARDENGQPQSVLISNNDLTASRENQDRLAKLQAELAQANRLSTLGQMSASLAHEINQPLASVGINAQAALRWLNRPSPELGEVQQCWQAISQEAERAGEVVKRVRAMTRKAPLSLQRLDLQALVRESVLLLELAAAIAGAVMLSAGAQAQDTAAPEGYQGWLSDINLLMNAITLLLRLWRESGSFSEQVANNGFFQDTAESAELIRIKLPGNLFCYPTLSGHKNRFALRFLPTAEQPIGDVPFQLACC